MRVRISTKSTILFLRSVLVMAALTIIVGPGGCTTAPGGGSSNGNGDSPPAEKTWKVVHNELPAALLSVQVVSNGDVYAVGSDTLDGNGPYVLHYDGSQWRRLLTGEVEGDLWWVHEVAADEIWMAGAPRLILRYRPSTGEFIRANAGDGSEIMYGIWGARTDDIWAVGGSTTAGVILRYDGASWSDVDLNDVVEGGALPPLFKVWGARADDVWIVGTAGVTTSYDGFEFTFQQTESARTLFTVHTDPTGESIAAVGGFQTGEIHEFIDGVWTDVTPPDALQVNGVNFGPGGEVFAVGIQASTLRRTQEGWIIEDNGLSELNDLDFHAVWVDPEGNAWSVGGNITTRPLDRGMLAYYGSDDPSGEISP